MREGQGSDGPRFERAAREALESLGFAASKRDLGFDLAADDGALVRLKILASSIRDFDATLTRLAVACSERGASRAILAWWAPRISLDRLRSEWSRLNAIFRPDLRARLQLVAASPEATVVLPPDRRGHEIAAALQRAGVAMTVSGSAIAPGRSDRSYEILKLLLGRFLRRERPISIGDLEAQSGLSYPTVAKQLRALGPAVLRGSNRSAELRWIPMATMAELMALSPKVRQSIYFTDTSGRPPDLAALVKRLRRQHPPRVALGGVIAAHHWQPDFDLDGTPRLDLEVHAPEGRPDLAFVAKLDPALALAGPEAVPIVAVHAVTRAVSLFTAERDRDVPWADPVEVLLDLYQLRLHQQAADFVQYWRNQ